MAGKEPLLPFGLSLLVCPNPSTNSPPEHLIASFNTQLLPSRCICVFPRHIPSSSFFPPLPETLSLSASLHDILSLRFPATFSWCPVPFTSPVFAHFHLLSLRPPILPAPDGSFYCVNFLMNVAVSLLFSACPRNGFGNLIHTSSALHGPQRAGPSKKQRNDSSAGGNEPVFAESVAH